MKTIAVSTLCFAVTVAMLPAILQLYYFVSLTIIGKIQ